MDRAAVHYSFSMEDINKNLLEFMDKWTKIGYNE